MGSSRTRMRKCHSATRSVAKDHLLRPGLVSFISGQFLLVFVFAPGVGFGHLRLVCFGFRFCARGWFRSSPASFFWFSLAPGVDFVYLRLVSFVSIFALADI